MSGDSLPVSHIRNFSIIAHIDHGKTTLTDRLLELTGSVSRGQVERVMDSNPIEKERGITIKLAPVRLNYEGLGGSWSLMLLKACKHKLSPIITKLPAWA